MRTIEPREFRNALGRFATGVTIVTMNDLGGQGVHGITVNAFMSVSLEPPLVAVSIDNRSRSRELLAASERFGISVLGEHQRGHSDAFARKGPKGEGAVYALLDDFPVVEGACAQLVCRKVAAHEAGDHTIFVGEALGLSYSGAQPLLFFGGRYSGLREMELEPA